MGMAILAWLVGMLAIFVLVVFFDVFMPIISNDIGSRVENLSVNLSTSSRITDTVNLARMAFPTAILVAVVGIILYMFAATQAEEPHTDII